MTDAPVRGPRTFLHVLVNTMLAGITTSFVWYGLVFWIYTETRNVIATGVISAAYMLLVALFSMFFGTLVDRFRKKPVMVWATVAALAVFLLDLAFLVVIGEDRAAELDRPWFWIFGVVLLAGAVVEQLRTVALSTTVTLLVAPERRANANGLVGAVQGIGLLVTSALSGLSIGFLGMTWTLAIGTAVLALTVIHLALLRIPEPRVVHADTTKWVDIRGGWIAVMAAPGLLALILFTTLNNLFGGVAMALMDPYGIDLFGVQGWGIWFAVISTGFLVGGGLIAWRGLGRNPIRTMLFAAAAIGLAGGLATIREWGWLYIVGLWLFMAIIPVVEAAEQTVIQRVVPYERQGRVFGFALTFEAAAAPITAVLVAPLAELWVIPQLREEGPRADWSWLVGTGDSRGIAVLLTISGFACAVLALLAFLMPQYRRLSRQFRETPAPEPQSESAG